MSNIEVYYKPNNELTIKVETRGVEEMFQELAPIQEVFSSLKCGKCGGNKIRLCHRKADNKYDVYELLCETKDSRGHSCGAKLALGKNDLNNLFPRRYEQEQVNGKWKPKLNADGQKVWLPNNGWVKWDKETKTFV